MNIRKNFGMISRAIMTLLWLVCVVVTAQAVQQIDIPVASEKSYLLPNGNIVVLDPGYDITSPSAIQNVGAVYLYNGETGALISMLTGSSANDHLGKSDIDHSSPGISILFNGNFLVHSPDWDNGAAQNAGALTFCNATTGCSGTVSAANSLVGTTANDYVGIQFSFDVEPFIGSIYPISSNGDFLVGSPYWDDGSVVDSGAITRCSGMTGCVGTINQTNSLVSSSANSFVGNAAGFTLFVAALSNGNYLIKTHLWNNNRGAVTFCSGATPCVGAINASNSLLGSSPGDSIGFITGLTNGNYLVSSNSWDNGAATNAGAVRFCSGTTGCTGVVSASNSLVGSTTNDDIGSGIKPLSNGNYVVYSLFWDNGAAVDAGAATWCNGTTGCVGAVSTANSLVGNADIGDAINVDGLKVFTFSNGNYLVANARWDNGSATNAGSATFCSGSSGCTGLISASNSLVGTNANDQVGRFVFDLSNGNFVVQSERWKNGSATEAGAVTFCSGTTGCPVGSITASNSLVGTSAFDHVGGEVYVLPNNNYIIDSQLWDDGGNQNFGAVTWCSGVTGCTGAVSPSNSLIGHNSQGAIQSVITLANGNYVVRSPGWDNPDTSASDVGAVTLCQGATGCFGYISPANSLVGSTSNDQIGSGDTPTLTDSFSNSANFLVLSPNWDNGSSIDAGAATWCSDTSGCIGTVNAGNSLVGSMPNDRVGSNGAAKLRTGKYLVISPKWNSNTGAVSFGDAATGTSGVVSASNSLIGSTPGDQVGNGGANSLLFSGFGDYYLVVSQNWDNGSITDAGAVTWCSSTTGCTGSVSTLNSLHGSTTGDQIGSGGVEAVFIDNANIVNYLVRSPKWDNGGIQNAGAVTYGAGNGGTTGAITAENSARGTVSNAVLTSAFGFGVSNEQIVVVRPTENLITLFRPTYTSVADGDWTNKMTWNYGSFVKPKTVVIPDSRMVNLNTIAAVNSLSVGCTGALSGGSALTFIIGTVKKDFCGSGSFTYPLGDTGNNYSPFAASVVGTGSLTAAVTDSTLTGLDATQSASRYWTLTETGDLTADLSFTYTNGDVVGMESGYKVFQRSGGTNTQITPFTLNTATNTATVTGIISFSDWGIGNSICPTITLSPTSLPNAALNSPYSQTVSATGGFGSYTFAVTSGSLPSGLGLNPNTGEISGIPDSPGTSNFTITATDENSCSGSQSFSNFTVSAQYQFSWFYYSDLLFRENVLNQVTAGSNVPVRFTLNGYKGNPYSQPPTSVQISCSTLNPIGTEQVIDRFAPDPYYSSLYDFYQTTWKTKTQWKFTCRRLTLYLTDGTTHSLNFYFK